MILVKGRNSPEWIAIMKEEVVEQAVDKRGREAGNKQRKRYKNEGVRRGLYKALKRPPVKGRKPIETSRVEKSREEKSKQKYHFCYKQQQ